MACVLEAGDGAVAFEHVAQRVDALGGVRAIAVCVDTTDDVVGEAAKGSACTASKAVNAVVHVRRAGGALEFLQHCIVLDAGRNDEAGGRTDVKFLAGQVDRLHWLGALELVDRQCVAVDAAH